MNLGENSNLRGRRGSSSFACIQPFLVSEQGGLGLFASTGRETETREVVARGLEYDVVGLRCSVDGRSFRRNGMRDIDEHQTGARSEVRNGYVTGQVDSREE